LKRHAIGRLDRTDILEDAFDVRQFRRAKTQKVSISGRTVRDVEPQVKQQGTLEQELIRVLRDADPVQKALNRVASQDQIEPKNSS
jgi:hypothetical protein